MGEGGRWRLWDFLRRVSNRFGDSGETRYPADTRPSIGGRLLQCPMSGSCLVILTLLLGSWFIQSVVAQTETVLNLPHCLLR